ncbi:FKBP-type peptidyl-prolyl cis-trans isomerase [Marinagarivorans cellulosilyticus]|uniref:Peptidyl-prolyl cis-trans isomerase n=1 Tax=Marinagarivorans cellulosilyticus TaxID=2721545 RepID=A0AAN2BKZ8_9GAMM|nr:FKBP-type peptidyl-prolyl cis-trans isomerase [Marinagarivorans cellulosilyticus]BCD98490.1 FKBP-type peptidyl-prolyl cis-trans isomerase FklB [Marinagarivorans cellulosilyticus]
MKTLFSRKHTFLAAAVTAALMTTGCNKPAEKAVAPAAAQTELTSLEQKVTYIVGYRMAKQAQQGEFALDKGVMGMAIQDVADEKEPRIAQEDQQKIMMEFQTQQEAKRKAETDKASAENLAKGKAFLEENAKKDGVKTTESGLQYKVITAVEDAASPKAEDTVKVHYHGTLIDGTVFDSSVDRGQPVTFPVSGVIQGWVEGLQLMKLGEKYELYIPAELAYGENGTGPIGPNAALIFEVELIEINPEAPAGHPHGGGDGHGH